MSQRSTSRKSARRLEREIEALVCRFLGSTLVVASAAGCQFIYDAQGRSIDAESSGAGSGAPPAHGFMPLDPLRTYLPTLSATGTPFGTAHCVDGHWDPMPYVQPAVPADYWALQQVIDNGRLLTVSEAGTLCDTATDPSRCGSTASAALDALTGSPPYIVTTTLGDAVQHYAPRETRTFLGTNNTLENALLMVLFAGYQPGHGGNPCTDATVQALDDVYEVYALHRVSYGTESTNERVLLQVWPKFQNVNFVTSVRERSFAMSGSVPGRRPTGLSTATPAAGSLCGRFFAHCAQLEAAAVFAFARMHAELCAQAAPSSLVQSALAALSDERRHACQLQRMAAAYAAAVPPIQVTSPRPRPLLEMAIENAAEGCARESWSAVVATHQAARSGDDALCAIMRRIAADERRHAALSFQVAHWLDTRLDAAERRLVRSAYADAMSGLRQEVNSEIEPELMHIAGLPGATAARVLLRNSEQGEVAQAWLSS